MDAKHILITEALLDAPIDNVWQAWQNKKLISKWWGPSGFTSTVEEFEFSDGGKFKVIMHGPDGKDYTNLYIFDKVARPELLIYTNVGSVQLGLEPFQSVMELKSEGDKTAVSLKMSFASQAEKDKHLNIFHADQGSKDLLYRLGEVAKSII